MSAESPTYERSVFINCPFDQEYAPILHAITFAIHLTSFTPRSALEDGDSGDVRLMRIYQLIQDCKYGIHDLSRNNPSTAQVDAKALPRLNMPFECGLFFGAKHFGAGNQNDKRILILQSEEHLTQKVLSDVAGNDPKTHHNEPTKAIDCVFRFLENNGVSPETLPGLEKVEAWYGQFQKDLPTLAKKLHRSKIEIEQLSHWKVFSIVAHKYIQKKFSRRGKYSSKASAPSLRSATGARPV